MGTAQIHQGQGMYIHTSFNAAFTLIRVERCLLSKPFPEGTAPLYSLKRERKSCSGASQLEGCFSSVNIDKASMSYNKPTSYSVWWSGRLKREQWAWGWSGSLRINDQITTNHYAIFGVFFFFHLSPTVTPFKSETCRASTWRDQREEMMGKEYESTTLGRCGWMLTKHADERGA